MNDTTVKTEEPAAPKDGEASATAASAEQVDKAEGEKSLAAVVANDSPLKDPLEVEPAPETAGNCDETDTKDENVKSESHKQDDAETSEIEESLPNDAVTIETPEGAINNEIKEESDPNPLTTPVEPMDTSSNETDLLKPIKQATEKSTTKKMEASNKEDIKEPVEEMQTEKKVPEPPKEASILEIDTEIIQQDSPESQLVIEEPILTREKSISPPIVITQVPEPSPQEMSPPLIPNPTPQEDTIPIVIEQKIPLKPPSPVKQVLLPKELVIPKEQLDILKRHLNQEQFASLKQLTEKQNTAKTSPEKQNEILNNTEKDIVIPVKIEKLISPALEKQLTIQRIPEKPAQIQKESSLEITTQKLHETLIQKRCRPEVPQTIPDVVTQKSSLEITGLKVENVDRPQKLPSPETSALKSTSPEKLSPSLEVAALIKSPQKDVDMVDVDVKSDEKKKASPATDVQAVNGDVTKEDQPVKRRASEEAETDSPLKKLCQEVEKTFPHHDTMISDYIQTATKNNIDEIQKHTEQLLAEIQTLRELAQKKEHEWNNILHLKKVKEEILLRLLRKKQVISFEKAPEINGSGKDPFDYLNQGKSLAIDKSDEISGLALKQPTPPINPSPLLPPASINTSMSSPMNSINSPMNSINSPMTSLNSPMNMNSPINSMNHMMQPPVMPVTTHFNPLAGLPPPYDKVAHMQNMQMQKSVFPQTMMMAGPTMPGFPRDMNGQLAASYMPMGRQGPTKDVKSIIADYRQRNPDVTPRRGRRMKTTLGPGMMGSPRQIAPKIEGLGNLGMIFNNLDLNQKAMLERLTQMQAANLSNGMSFKDVLVQFASMQHQQPGMMPGRPDCGPARPDCGPPRPECAPTRLECGPSRPEASAGRAEAARGRRPERHEEQKPPPALPPPPPYPEISLLPVSAHQDGQNSLLHGILTKQACPAQSRSPTLAKLLTSPERKQAALPTFGQAKNCGEITITPVQPAPPEPAKQEEVVQLDDEESPASEGSAEAEVERPEATEAEAEAEEAPLCQGCRKRDAQFVCAGCANQWYCSRDCQVAAWDDHSEMCSG